MSLNDLPLSFLFTLFLALFVLIGLYPAWKRTLRRIRAKLKSLEQDGSTERVEKVSAERAKLTEQYAELQLDDFETLILWQLVQCGPKGLSRKQLRSKLLLEPPVLRSALESLLHRGLVEVNITSFLQLRFYLSKRGRDFAIQMGYINPVLE